MDPYLLAHIDFSTEIAEKAGTSVDVPADIMRELLDHVAGLTSTLGFIYNEVKYETDGTRYIRYENYKVAEPLILICGTISRAIRETMEQSK